MNEHLSERIPRGGGLQKDREQPAPTKRPLVISADQGIREYFRDRKNTDKSSEWLSLPEIPNAKELWEPVDEHEDEEIELQENVVVGPYASKDQYLETHYRLIREDGVAPLRNAVREVQLYPNLMEVDSEEGACIYERVHISGFTFENVAIATRLKFSLERTGKKINWQQSKRLRPGSLVALSPSSDSFKSVCKLAVIAARPLSGLTLNPPEVDVYFSQPDDFEIDPQEEWIMVESRTGFFEAYRHTLQSLQHLQQEAFPLARHIVKMDRDIQPATHVVDQPLRDMRHAFPEEGGSELHVDILDEWPDLPSTLDQSQLEALKRILTKSLAIVQGPPGTGKTHLSVMALDLMLQNSDPSDPPIIVTAQTNHALDQLLRRVSRFEPDFIRMGGMTQDIEIVKPRTLFEVKSARKVSRIICTLREAALAKLKRLSTNIRELLAPFTLDEQIHPPITFKEHQVISESQYNSLLEGAKAWVSGIGMTNEMAVWLGDEKLEPRRTEAEDLGLTEFEEDEELDVEELQELEAENKKSDEDDIQSLKGFHIHINEPWTGREKTGATQKAVDEELKKPNFWDISRDLRGSVYKCLQIKMKATICDKIRQLLKAYKMAATDAKIGRFETDLHFLREARIIGTTTTGLSKYRAIFKSLNPRVILIEEAAETLEAYATAACIPSLQQLILVGDHAQLRGHPNDHDLAGSPFYLDVSLLERLVRNKLGFTQLNVQRRMAPEIRRLLMPIYDELYDHPVVTSQAPVPGMGGVNSFFFVHQYEESNDDHMSKLNYAEAEMICHFFVYLTKNGILPKEITVLTCYSGQKRLLKSQLHKQPSLRGERVNVETVDSYQGEENVIVILSLVRSNMRNNIGFLADENRACVAFSRAQRGFYIFGDARALCKSSMLWWYVVQRMASNPCRVGFFLPTTCTNHGHTTYHDEAENFKAMDDGGCMNPCRGKLACNHPCPRNCHPFPHDNVLCQKRCTKVLPCGHKCIESCSAEECKSDCTCEKAADKAGPKTASSPAPVKGQIGSRYKPGSMLPGSSQAFKDYAAGGHVESDRALAQLASKERAKLVQNQQLRPEAPTFKPAPDTARPKAPVDSNARKTNLQPATEDQMSQLSSLLQTQLTTKPDPPQHTKTPPPPPPLSVTPSGRAWDSGLQPALAPQPAKPKPLSNASKDWLARRPAPQYDAHADKNFPALSSSGGAVGKKENVNPSPAKKTTEEGTRQTSPQRSKYYEIYHPDRSLLDDDIVTDPMPDLSKLTFEKNVENQTKNEVEKNGAATPPPATTNHQHDHGAENVNGKGSGSGSATGKSTASKQKKEKEKSERKEEEVNLLDL